MRILIKTKTARSSEPLSVTPCSVTVQHRPLRVLDFDIENRPLSYLGSDFTTAEVTAIAWAWCDQPADVTVHLLGESELSEILHTFRTAYDAADMVTGHFIRGHDLPMVNGAMMELGMAPLGDKPTQDTKLDLMRSKGISLSQESLGAMLNLEQPKVQMNQHKWRAANRLTAEGLASVRERVTGDVRQHIALRAELLRLGYLSGGVKWKSGVSAEAVYVP